MRRLLAASLLALGLAAGQAQAQDFTFGWNPRSGDVWVDVWLGDMNRYGSRYRDPFVDELVRYHGAPRDLVVELLARRWAPGDIYFACALARLAGRPCRYVVDLWERDHGQGWGAMAKRLGIKPGSAQFHQLKRGMVPTYDRWGRPIELDAQLQRDFPGRGKGQQQGKPPGKGRSDDHGNVHGDHGGKGHGNAPGNSGGKGKGKGKN
ncbi:MAG: hypothetical protein ACOY82_04820 [Pseudomonadota bacterium]